MTSQDDIEAIVKKWNEPFEVWWRHQGFGLFDGRHDKADLRGAFGAGALYGCEKYEPIVQAVAKAPCLCRNAAEEGRCLGCDAKAALGLPLPDKAHASKSGDLDCKADVGDGRTCARPAGHLAPHSWRPAKEPDWRTAEPDEAVLMYEHESREEDEARAQPD